MIEYFFLFLFALLGTTKIGRSGILVLCLLMMMCVLISGRGIDVGTDTFDYSETFKGLTTNPESWKSDVIFDPGFAYICYMFKTYISDNPLDCWSVIGLYWVLSFFFFARKYTGRSAMALSLFVLYASYFKGFNIIRQCFALSCVMVVFTYYDIMRLKKREIFVSELLILIIAFLFHETMLTFFLFPLFYSGAIKWLFKKKWLIIIILSSYVICLTGTAVQYAMSFLNSTGIEGALINYMNRVNIEESGYSFLKLSLINVYLIYIVYKCKSCDNIFLLFSIYAVVFLNLFGMIVIELVRVYESLMVFGIVGIAQMLTQTEYRVNSKLLYAITILVFSVIYINNIIKGYGGITPYVFR